MTGLACSGKTTIAMRTAEILRKKYKECVIVVDGDVIRKKINADLGFTKEERDKNITRIADICDLITKNGVLAIASVISPTKKIRDYARKNIVNFSEIYVKCPIDICKKRDVKKHYAMYKRGEIKNFVGLNIPYEEPTNPDLVLDTQELLLEDCCTKLISHLYSRLEE